MKISFSRSLKVSFLSTIAALQLGLLFATSVVAQSTVSSPEAASVPARSLITPTPTVVPTVSSCVPVDCRGQPTRSSYDVNGDCRVTSEDTALVVDYINRSGVGATTLTSRTFDTNQDGFISPLDVLEITNLLNSSSCNVVATPTTVPTSSPTNTPLPTATPTQTQCKYYDMSGWACDTRQQFRMGCDNNALWGRTVMSADPSIRARFTQLSCIQNILAGCGTHFDDLIAGGNTADLCVQYAFINIEKGLPVGTYIYATGLYPFDGRFIMDENCRVVQQSTPADICGSAIFRADTTPLSLILDNSKSLPVSTVKFDLDLSEQGKFYTWRASSLSPLIVLDPGKSGQITSAKQLFGKWTWGGRELADPNCRPTPNSKCQGTPWENGFAALKTLDLDGNKILSGAELAALSLWFDHNQNASSEAGEVVDLRGYGIVSLSLGTPDKDQESGDLSLRNGALFSEKGKTVEFDILDWTSMSSESQTELVEAIKNLHHDKPSPGDMSSKNLEDDGAVLPVSTNPMDAKSPGPLYGIWKWRLDKQSEINFGTNGIFEFSETGGRLYGSNIAVRPIISESSERLREVVMNRMRNLRINGDGFTFEARDDQGNRVFNRATLDSTGRKLSGSSATVLKNMTRINYTWEAEKLSS
jgi:hypothetical protein